MFQFYNYNISVLNPQKSLAFYETHFGLQKVHEMTTYDGAFTMYFLSDGKTNFFLELTEKPEHTAPYNLGEKPFHFAFCPENFDLAYSKHKQAGIIVSECLEAGIYFVEDPDGYKVEVVKQIAPPLPRPFATV